MDVSIIDYGMGNIRSVSNAIDYLGQEPEVVRTPEELDGEKIIIPGVGSFGDAMKSLGPFIQKIDELLESQRPLLGICLGMQVLYESSEESPGVEGLSLLGGKVTRVDTDLRLPLIGWNNLKVGKDSPLFEGIENGHVYYVHSYHPENSKARIATSDYGAEITANAQKGKGFGTQFHPEKSGKLGLKILDNFLRLE